MFCYFPNLFSNLFQIYINKIYMSKLYIHKVCVKVEFVRVCVEYVYTVGNYSLGFGVVLDVRNRIRVGLCPRFSLK